MLHQQCNLYMNKNLNIFVTKSVQTDFVTTMLRSLECAQGEHNNIAYIYIENLAASPIFPGWMFV